MFLSRLVPSTASPFGQFCIKAFHNSAHLALEIRPLGVMPRHFDGALAEGVGDCALVATALAKDDGESMPQPVWGQVRTDKPIAFELLSQLTSCGTEAAQGPRGAPGIGAKRRRHMCVVENICQRGRHGPENWLSSLGLACCNLAAFREIPW